MISIFLLFYSITLIPFSNTGEEIIKAKRALARKLRGVAKLFAIGAEHLVSTRLVSIIHITWLENNRRPLIREFDIKTTSKSIYVWSIITKTLRLYQW